MKFIQFFFILLLFSCNKIQDNNLKIQIVNNENIEFVNKWVKDIKKNTSSTTPFTDSLLNTIVIDKIETYNLNSIGELIYIPSSYLKNSGVVIFKNNFTGEVVHSLIVEVIDYNNSIQISNIRDLIVNFYEHKLPYSFNGKINGFSLENKFLWEFGIVKGKIKYERRIQKNYNNVNSGNIKSNSLVNSTSTKSNNCIAYYSVTYWSDGTTDWELINVECDSPCEITRSLNPSTESKITKFCFTGVTIGGGGGPSITNDKITTKFINPCIAEVWNKIQNKDLGLKGEIDKILYNTFGLSTKYNLVVKDEEGLNNNGIPVAGTTLPPVRNSDGSISITCIINATTVASQEYIAATIYHEVIHAYLNTVNPDLINNKSSHTEMYNNYMKSLESTLIKTFSNTDPSVLHVLALDGIVNIGIDFGCTPEYLSMIKAEVEKQVSGRFGTPCTVQSNN